MPDFSIAIALLRKPVEETYSRATTAVQKKIALFKTQAKIKALHKKLWQIQRVKTIWNTDRPLSLSSIYFPVSVQLTLPDNKQIRQVNSVDDLQHPHVIVYGTAGQGKSILMKYLVGREIRSGKRIPLLCELRNLKGVTLEQHLTAQFAMLLGVAVDQDVYTTFAETGTLSFLLDGFDEIEDEQIQSTLQQIDVLSFKYPTAKIVLTSRPNSDCRNLTGFNVVNIKPLDKTDLSFFYRKITKDAEFSDRLVRAIGASATQIQSLITTPLLATLLAISYRAAHKIPIEFSDFYEELFQILLVRHDASKLGWRRRRSSGLNDRQIQQVFEAFCFAAKRRRQSSLEVEVARTIAKESADNYGLSVDVDLFLQDIEKITCLIIREGKKIEFVHASVPQFFASMYVKGRTEPQSASFYTQLLKSVWRTWLQEIFFLTQIDAHRFDKYFAIPDMEAALGFVTEAGESAVEELLKTFFVAKAKVPDSTEFRYYTNNQNSLSWYCTSNLEKKIFLILFSSHYPAARVWQGFDGEPMVAVRSYWDIARDRGEPVVAAVRLAMQEFVQQCGDSLTSKKVSVANAERVGDFIAL